MDFHLLNRKQLQSLCKKHGIPANKTNLHMADLLTAALKEKDNSILEENRNDKTSEDEQKNIKKVRFSPDIETREYEPSGYKRLAKRTRRTTILTSSSLNESKKITLPDKVGNKRGRGNGKIGSVLATRQPHTEADKTVSSVMENEIETDKGTEVCENDPQLQESLEGRKKSTASQKGVAYANIDRDGGETRKGATRSARNEATFTDELVNGIVKINDGEATKNVRRSRRIGAKSDSELVNGVVNCDGDEHRKAARRLTRNGAKTTDAELINETVVDKASGEARKCGRQSARNVAKLRDRELVNDEVVNMDGVTTRMGTRGSTRTRAKLPDPELVNDGVVNRNTRSKAQSVVGNSAVEGKDEVKKYSKGIARASSKRKSVDVPVESRQFGLKESRKRQKIMNLNEVAEDKASSETIEQTEKALPPASKPRISRRKTIVLNPNIVAESASDEAFGKLKALQQRALQKEENYSVRELRRSNRRASIYSGAAMSVEVKEIAGNVGDVKEISQSVQEIETTTVVSESLVAKPSRAFTRHASKMKQKAIAGVPNLVETTCSTLASDFKEEETLKVAGESVMNLDVVAEDKVSSETIEQHEKALPPASKPRISRRKTIVLNPNIVAESASDEAIGKLKLLQQRALQKEENYSVRELRRSNRRASIYSGAAMPVEVKEIAENVADVKDISQSVQEAETTAVVSGSLVAKPSRASARHASKMKQKAIAGVPNLVETMCSTLASDFKEEETLKVAGKSVVVNEHIGLDARNLISDGSIKGSENDQCHSSAKFVNIMNIQETLKVAEESANVNEHIVLETLSFSIEDAHDICQSSKKCANLVSKEETLKVGEGSEIVTENTVLDTRNLISDCSIEGDADDHCRSSRSCTNFEDVEEELKVAADFAVINDDNILDTSKGGITEGGVDNQCRSSEKCATLDNNSSVELNLEEFQAKELDVVTSSDDFRGGNSSFTDKMLTEKEISISKDAYCGSDYISGHSAEVDRINIQNDGVYVLERHANAEDEIENELLPENGRSLLSVNVEVFTESIKKVFQIDDVNDCTTEVGKPLEEDEVTSGEEMNNQDYTVGEEEHGQPGHEAHHRKASRIDDEVVTKNLDVSPLEGKMTDAVGDSSCYESEAFKLNSFFQECESMVEKLAVEPSYLNQRHGTDFIVEQSQERTEQIEEIRKNYPKVVDQSHTFTTAVNQDITAGEGKTCELKLLSPTETSSHPENEVEAPNTADSFQENCKTVEPSNLNQRHGTDFIVEQSQERTEQIEEIKKNEAKVVDQSHTFTTAVNQDITAGEGKTCELKLLSPTETSSHPENEVEAPNTADSFQENCKTVEPSNLNQRHGTDFIVEQSQERTEQIEEIKKNEAKVVDRSHTFTTAVNQDITAGEGKTCELKLLSPTETSSHPENEVEAPNTADSFQENCKTVHLEKDNIQAAGDKETVALGRYICNVSELIGSNNNPELKDVPHTVNTSLRDNNEQRLDQETTRSSFDGEETDVSVGRQVNTLPQFCMDELEDESVSVPKNSRDEICEKVLGDDIIYDREVGDSNVGDNNSGEPFLSEATEISSPADSYCARPEMELNRTYEESDGQMEGNNIIIRGDDSRDQAYKMMLVNEVANNPTGSPSLRNDARDHDKVANEQLSHSDTISKGVFIDDDGVLNKVSCENKTETQPREAWKQQYLCELGDEVLTVANSEQMTDTKNLDTISPFKGKTSDAVGDSSCHEPEAFELNLFFEEGDYALDRPANIVDENESKLIPENGRTLQSVNVEIVTESIKDVFQTDEVNDCLKEFARTIEEDGVISGLEWNKQEGTVGEEHGQQEQEAHHRKASLGAGAVTTMADMRDGANEYSNKVQRNHVEEDRVNGIETTEHDESTDEVPLEVEAPNTKDSFQADCKTFLHFEKDNIQASEHKETAALRGNACDDSELIGSNFKAEVEDGKGVIQFVQDEKDINSGQHDFASGEALTFPHAAHTSIKHNDEHQQDQEKTKFCLHGEETDVSERTQVDTVPQIFMDDLEDENVFNSPVVKNSSEVGDSNVGETIISEATKISSHADSYCGRPEMELHHSFTQPNEEASYEEFAGQMEEDKIISDGMVQKSDEVASNPTDNPSLGNDAKDVNEIATEVLNVHSDAYREGILIDDDGILNKLSCENITEIQPIEAGREQCLSELGDEVVTVANSEETVDAKNLVSVSPLNGMTSDVAGDSSCQGSEAFELNLFLEKGECTVEKQDLEASAVNLVSVDAGSFPENASFTVIAEEASNLERGYSANFIVEEVQEVIERHQFEEMKKTEAVMVNQSHPFTASGVHQEEFDGQMEDEILISGDDGRLQKSVEVANSPTDNTSLGFVAREHNEAHADADADSEGGFIDNTSFPNEQSREYKTEIQPIEAGKEHCLFELGDKAVTVAHSEQTVDAKNLDVVSPFKGRTTDAVCDSCGHESDAFELKLFFDEGEYAVEKQDVEASPANVVNVDAGSFPENASCTLIAGEASNLERGLGANSIVEELEKVSGQFDEMEKTEAMMVDQSYRITASGDQEVTAEVGCELKLTSETSAVPENEKQCESLSFQVMKRTSISGLIQDTPRKVGDTYAMKENAVGVKMEKLASFTASRMSQKRRPLEDLRNQ